MINPLDAPNQPIRFEAYNVKTRYHDSGDVCRYFITVEVDEKDWDIVKSCNRKSAHFAIGMARMDYDDPKEQTGARCKTAIGLCKQPEFHVYVKRFHKETADEDGAKRAILKLCSITTRKELDTNDIAWQKFQAIQNHYLGAK